MAKLTTERRKSLNSEVFGLPGERKYPMPDASHARNAKARASQQYNKGNLSLDEKEKIDRKADYKLVEKPQGGIGLNLGRQGPPPPGYNQSPAHSIHRYAPTRPDTTPLGHKGQRSPHMTWESRPG